MGLIGNLFGVPKKHEEEKKDLEVVKAPEFDLTQYAKKLALGIPIFVAAVVAALEEFTDVEQTEAIVIGVLGLVAVALFGVCLVMAADLAARAFITASGAGEKAEKAEDGEKGKGDPAAGSEIVTASPGTLVWLENTDEPRPLLAIASDGGEVSSYLVAAGSKVTRTQAGKNIEAIGGAPKWHPAAAIQAVKPAKWP